MLAQGNSIHAVMTALIAARGRAAKASRVGRGFLFLRRMIVSVALRSSAMTWGADPVRTREASSMKVTSRTWNRRFSICQ